MGSNPVRHGTEWDPEYSRTRKGHRDQDPDTHADQAKASGELHHVRALADRQGAEVHG